MSGYFSGSMDRIIDRILQKKKLSREELSKDWQDALREIAAEGDDKISNECASEPYSVRI